MTEHTTQNEVEAIFPSHFFFWKDKKSEPLKFTKEGVRDVLDTLELDYDDSEIEFKVNDEEDTYRRFAWIVNDGELVIGYSNIIPYQEDIVYVAVGISDNNKPVYADHDVITFQADIPTQYIAAVASQPHNCDLWSVNGKPCAYVSKVKEDGICIVREFEKIEDGFYLPNMETVEELTDQEYIDFIAKIPFEQGNISQHIQIVRTTMQERVHGVLPA